MPEVQYTTQVALPREAVWEFVKDMNNWAPYLTGYQTHEVLSETDSIWTLKGDVGVLARIVKLKAHVTEWNGPERVSFTLTGLNEQVDGDGTLEMGATVASDGAPSEAPLAPAPVVRRSFVGRILDAVFRFFFRRMHGPAPVRALPTAGPSSRLKFRLRMDAGGPTGPLVNAMLAPALLPAAEDLANKIAAHLERGPLRP
ncbi:MAG TPA: SRPBCC family protein [Polyangiaceae bacterium]